MRDALHTRYLDEQPQVHVLALGRGPRNLLVAAAGLEIDTLRAHPSSTAAAQRRSAPLTMSSGPWGGGQEKRERAVDNTKIGACRRCLRSLRLSLK